MALPTDPIMLLSVVNLKLRDYFKNLDALCEDRTPTRLIVCKAACRRLRVRRTAQPVCLIYPENATAGWTCSDCAPGPDHDKKGVLD